MSLTRESDNEFLNKQQWSSLIKQSKMYALYES